MSEHLSSEFVTIGKMVDIYCAAHHDGSSTEASKLGQPQDIPLHSTSSGPQRRMLARQVTQDKSSRLLV
jgi:hypothetical protein